MYLNYITIILYFLCVFKLLMFIQCYITTLFILIPYLFIFALIGGEADQGTIHSNPNERSFNVHYSSWSLWYWSQLRASESYCMLLNLVCMEEAIIKHSIYSEHSNSVGRIGVVYMRTRKIHHLSYESIIRSKHSKLHHSSTCTHLKAISGWSNGAFAPKNVNPFCPAKDTPPAPVEV